SDGCRVPSERFRKRARETASGEAGTESKAHHRPETVGSGYPREIQTGDGGLETRGKHGCAVDSRDLRANFRTEERQALEIYFVTGGRNDVLGQNFALAAVRGPQLEAHPAVLDLGTLGRVSEQERHAAHDLVFGKPASRRTKVGADRLEAETLGQIVKRHRCVGKEARPPTGANSRLRMAHSLPPRTGLVYRLLVMEIQRCLAGYELHVGIGVA